MSAHLSQAEIAQIEDAILASNLDYNAIRPALLAGVDPHFRAIMPPPNLPSLVQLTLDLNFMNPVERLANGTVPLKAWLSNAARFLRSLPEQSQLLEKKLDEIDHRTTGAPSPDITKLPESKEAIVHQDDMVTFTFMEMGVNAGRSVAKLMVQRYESGQRRIVNGNPVVYLGTGWLITGTLMLTNHHVVNARNEGESAAAESDLLLQGKSVIAKFDFDGDGVQGIDSTVARLEAWDQTLDYAVLRLPDTGRKPLRRAPAALAMADGDYLPVNIIQHPEGTSKKYAIRNNLVTAVSEAEVRYFTDTKQGSSGSPVLDDKWQVVALHRGSTVAQNVKFQGKSVAWVNIGTQMSAIAADLSARYPALFTELKAAQA